MKRGTRISRLSRAIHTNDDETDTPSLWVDLASPSHPFFFESLTDALQDISVTMTVRNKTETASITSNLGLPHSIVGQDFDNVLLRQLGIPLRTAQLALRAPPCDVSLSSRNAMCVLASHVRQIPSIHFTDNDITAHIDGLRAEELYHRLEATATYNVVPEAFATEELSGRFSPTTVETYGGCKEDVYVATFDPDPTFTHRLPFEEYVVLRPEALTATYVDASKSLVPALLRGFVEAGENVVYLPRRRGDETYADSFPDDTVFVPDDAIDGLQLAWHSRCVLTGSGTMAREAACMGKPAVSFFPNELLSVDKEMVREGRIRHSRDPDAILDYIATLSDDWTPDRSRSRSVRNEVVELTQGLVERCVRR